MGNITGFIGSFLVDFPQLLCGEEDIKEMGIPMGPRKKLIGYLNSQKSIMVSFYFTMITVLGQLYAAIVV